MLVTDIAQSAKGTIPPYNDELARAVVDEAQEHHRSILRLIGDIQKTGASLDEAKPDDAASILVHHQAVLRNKRALLVYLNERMRRVRALRWEVGTGLPEVVAENLSHSERSFFTQYAALVNKYQGRRGGVGFEPDAGPRASARPQGAGARVGGVRRGGHPGRRGGSPEKYRSSALARRRAAAHRRGRPRETRR